ncbi:MAG TPA: DUF4097 family beta strand repeat-containing protein [Flavisolibacter sp.]|nr:DUF4097 family beta strand repeat-containing protein [Flavisolibacter sp.]
MKKYLFLSILASCSILVNAQPKEAQEPYLTKTLADGAIKQVEVETSAGSIAVTGGANSEARIEVYVTKNNSRSGDAPLSREEIQKRLDSEYDLNISVANGKVSATAKPKERNMDWKRALIISFKLFVPQNITSELETSGGSIHLKNLTGSQNFSTSGGSLHVDGLSGKVKGKTSGGSIHLADSKDDIDLETSGGNITAEASSGNLQLSTSGGSLELTGLGGTIKANTSGGSIRGKNISGELDTHTSGGSITLSDLSCSLEASTSGGHMDVAIKELGKYVRLTNSGGSVDLQLPSGKGVDLKLRANSIKKGTLTGFQGTVEDDEIEGKLNGGGVPVTVRAGNGRINLSVQ